MPVRGRFGVLDINPMTLKLEGDLDILKMYLHTEDEVTRLKHSELLTVDETCIVFKVNGQGQISPTFNNF